MNGYERMIAQQVRVKDDGIWYAGIQIGNMLIFGEDGIVADLNDKAWHITEIIPYDNWINLTNAICGDDIDGVD